MMSEAPIRAGTVTEGGADALTGGVRRVLGHRPPRGGPARLVVVLGPPDVGRAAVAPLARRLPGTRVRCAGPDTHDPPDGGVAASLAGTSTLSSASRRVRFARWTDGILAEAAEDSLLLIVDEADRVDPTSLRWLAHLLRAARRTRLLVVLARRLHAPADVPSDLAELLARHDAHRVVLEAQIADHLEAVPTDTGRGGHPAGRVARFGRHRATTAAPHAWQVARAVAVLDGSGRDVVAALAGVSGPHFAEALRRLRWSERILGPETDVLRFRSPALRDRVLAGLTSTELAGWRRDAAKRLCDLGRPVQEAADQLLATPPSPEPWMQLVVRMAANLLSRQEPRTDPTRHLQWLRTAARAEERTWVGVESDVELMSAWVHVDAGRSVDHLTESLAHTDGRMRVAVAVELGLALAAVGRLGDGLALLRVEHERWCPAAGEADLDVDAAARSAERFLAAVPRHPVDGTPRAAPTMTADPVPSTSSGATVAGRRALAMDAWLGMVGATSPPEALATLARRALVVGTAVPTTTLLAGVALYCCGATAEALTALEALGGPDGGVTGSLSGPDDAALAAHRALVRFAGADVAGALRDSGRALAAAEEAGRQVPVVLRAVHAAGLLESGDPGAWLLDGGPDGTDVWWDHLVRERMRARSLRVDHRDDEALAVLEAAERTAAEVGLVNPVLVPSWLDLALTHVDLGDTAAARRVLDAAAQRVGRWPVHRATALFDLLEGVLDGGAAGREIVETAAETLAAGGQELEALEARTRLGALLAADGFERDARAVLRAVVQIATRVGARATASRAHDELVIAGGRMRAPTGDRRDGLTTTEREVATLAARGLSNRGIADRLVVSLRTVELHLTHVYRKLAITSRVQLAGALGAPA